MVRDAVIDKKREYRIDELRGNGETILVVDDIAQQREIAADMLTKLGYIVYTVPSGEAAIAHIKEHSVDLLLLDMIMEPGLDGLNTYRQIVIIKPDQQAVIASGFSETDRVKETQRLGAGPFVKKPYSLEKIGLAVKEALGKDFSF